MDNDSDAYPRMRLQAIEAETGRAWVDPRRVCGVRTLDHHQRRSSLAPRCWTKALRLSFIDDEPLVVCGDDIPRWLALRLQLGTEPGASDRASPHLGGSDDNG